MTSYQIGTLFSVACKTTTFKKGERVELVAYARIPKTGENAGYFKSILSGACQVLNIDEVKEINQ